MSEDIAMILTKHPITQLTIPAGDRSPLTTLYALESRLHLELIRTGPTPALLRELASVEARLNGGGR